MSRTFGIALTGSVLAFGSASTTQAALLYGGALTGNTAVKALNGTGAGNTGIGDDYNTGAASIVLTGLSFQGGLNAGTTTDQLFIDFYSTAGVRVATIYPSQAEVSGNSAVHTLSSSDFTQNGVTGITLPGAGYVVFSPYAFNGSNATPQFALYAGGAAPTVGSNDVNNAAGTTPDPTTGLPVLSTGRYFFGFGSVNQYAAFTLTGTAVPEPASLGVVMSGGVLALRRRRAAVAV